MSADTMKSTPVPSAFEVREVFEGLLGRAVEWKGTSHKVDPLDGATIGAYVNDFGAVKALIVADIALTAWAGSAIALLPHNGAEKAIKEGLLSAAQFDNMAEILNVAASIFNKPGTPHLKLGLTFAPREHLPEDVERWVLVPAGRIDGTLIIQGYGQGRISVIVGY